MPSVFSKASSSHPSPILAGNRVGLDEALATLPRPLALVMTMGAIHEGHLDLVREAQQRAASVVVSIFVNPLQFGPSEDFEAYPRALAADMAALTSVGVQVVYAPDVDDVYPNGDPLVCIDPGTMGQCFEGAMRLGHFAGVLTVVHKFLGRIHPDVAFFGQKDAQQLCLIQRMVRDLELPVDIVAVPTRRDPDGLALSSRNAYLSPAERLSALILPKSLQAGVASAQAIASAPLETTASSKPSFVAGRIRDDARRALASGIGTPQAADALGVPLSAVGFHTWHRPGAVVLPDYLDLVDPITFRAVPADFHGEGLLIGAIRVGATRLIDNMPVHVA